MRLIVISFLFFPFFLLNSIPDRVQLNAVYIDCAQAVRNVVLGSTTFASQNFTLWDYITDAPDVRTLSDHFQGLLKFIKENQVKRIIIFIKDPNDFSFFQPDNFNATDNTTNNFLYWYNQLTTTPTYTPEIVVFFTIGALSWTGQPSHAADAYDQDEVPAAFEDILAKLDWATYLNREISDYNTTSTPTMPLLKGINIDPEGLTGASEYQLVINTVDYYRWDVNQTANQNAIFTNGAFAALTWENSFTVGIDEKPVTFADLHIFPFDSSSDNDQEIMKMIYVTLNDDATAANFPGTTIGATSPYSTITSPSWRTGTSPGLTANDPLLNTIYIEAYDPTITYIYTLASAPYQAAQDFLRAFQDLPYDPKTGTISKAAPASDVIGVGTSFLSEIPLNSPLGTIQGVSLGSVSAITSDLQLTLSGGSTFFPSSFYGTELLFKWTFPYITTTMTSNIYLFFSCNSATNLVGPLPFFGS